MTPNEQRLTIATHLGWTEIKHNPKTDLYYGTPPKDHKPVWDVLIPNYTTDLNACAEMEKRIPSELHHVYIIKLGRPVRTDDFGRNGQANWEGLTDIVFATASQRCEAFLRTLNLWKEN